MKAKRKKNALRELEGSGWKLVEPPLERDEPSVIARYNDCPIRSGLVTERIADNESMFHIKYRSGVYDLELKIDFDVGRGLVKVDRAEGYS